MNRRDFATVVPLVLLGSRLSWAASEPIANADDPETGLRVMFRRGSLDTALPVYQNELRGTLAALRTLGYPFHAVRWETPRLPINGYLTGTCSFSLMRFPAALAPVIGNFLSRGPDRRVCVAIGETVVNAFTPEDANGLAVALRSSASLSGLHASPGCSLA